jgi:hypothetical protein
VEIVCHEKEIAELKQKLEICKIPQKELALLKRIKQLEAEDEAEKRHTPKRDNWTH